MSEKTEATAGLRRGRGASGVTVIGVCLLIAWLGAGGCGRSGAGPAAAQTDGQAATAPAESDKAVFDAGGVVLNFDRSTATVHNLRVGPGKRTLARGPGGAYVEIVDLRDGRTYDPLSGRFTIRNWRVTGAGADARLRFTQDFAGAPFAVAHDLRATPAGVRWDVAVTPRAGEKLNRSVQVNWVFQAPYRWWFWTPRNLTPHRINHFDAYRAVYGHGGFSPWTTIIPVAGMWTRGGGLVAWSPPDVTKTQIIFAIDTHRLPDPPRGSSRLAAERPTMRIEHHLVGLRPGKSLNLGICLAGDAGGWRTTLGTYARTYPELFEPVPAVRKIEGMYAITGLGRMTDQIVKDMAEAGVNFVELHGSFAEYGHFISDEMLADPNHTVVCKPHPAQKISLNSNRRWLAKIKKTGIAPFMYFYNCHARPDTIAKKWPGATFRDEKGRPVLKWYTEPAVYGPPDSPFGRNMIDQIGRMLKAYPDMAGVFIDNFGIEMVSFAHDDGVTMIHNRPAYDINRNHQGLGRIIFERTHKAGKLVMINKLATIESARGADMLLMEISSMHSIYQHALTAAYRPVFPLGMGRGKDARAVERAFQHLLLVGGTGEWGMHRKDPATAKAYRPLTDALVGKRWVLDVADPLTVPEPLSGQIFRIDPAAAHGGDVVVVLADLTRSWNDGDKTATAVVKVRLPEAGRIARATWLAADKSADKPVACKMEAKNGELTIQVPTVGAAGIIRLSR